MESTWESRDLPVLDAVVRYFEEEYDGEYPTTQLFADRLGMDLQQVARAVSALSPTYLVIAPSMGGPGSLSIDGVTDEARRAVGQWPSPEVFVQRFTEALLELADREPDPVKKSRIRQIAEAVGRDFRSVVIEAAGSFLGAAGQGAAGM
jgi:hypothetical protein